MVNSALIVAGITLMVISVGQCIRLIRLNKIRSLQWAWYVIFSLIVFFLIGYVAYYILNSGYGNIPMSSLLVSLILFFGAIFVIAVLSISYQLFKALTERSSEIDKTNTDLVRNTQELQNKQAELKRAQELLHEKNKELVKMLDDFYMMRVNIQKDIETGKLVEENQKIKERLDTIKGK
jgi:predicted PurR-regulated permease PerM